MYVKAASSIKSEAKYREAQMPRQVGYRVFRVCWKIDIIFLICQVGGRR